MSFPLFLICVSLASTVCFILGAHLNYHRGYGDGIADAEAAIEDLDDLHESSTPDDIASIRWQLTATGRRALEAAVMENSAH